MNIKQVGKNGESWARQFYERLGYQCLAQNFVARGGEIDLIFKKNGVILIVEVKTRQNANFGWAEESITDKKLASIQTAYTLWASQNSAPTDFNLEICLIYIKNKQVQIERLAIIDLD